MSIDRTRTRLAGAARFSAGIDRCARRRAERVLRRARRGRRDARSDTRRCCGYPMVLVGGCAPALRDQRRWAASVGRKPRPIPRPRSSTGAGTPTTYPSETPRPRRSSSASPKERDRHPRKPQGHSAQCTYSGLPEDALNSSGLIHRDAGLVPVWIAKVSRMTRDDVGCDVSIKPRKRETSQPKASTGSCRCPTIRTSCPRLVGGPSSNSHIRLGCPTRGARRAHCLRRVWWSRRARGRGDAGRANGVDDLNVLRAGGTTRVLGPVRAPSTIRTFLRSFTHGYVLQPHTAHRRLLAGFAG